MIGLIGIGMMGRGIGHSLLRAGHSLSILANRRREAVDELVALGATEAASAAGMAPEAEAVILCLPSEAAAREVLFGPSGIAATARPGLLVLECSTLTPAAGRDFSERLARIGVHFVDAPVTGGPTEAMQGRLNALVGGDATPQTAEAILSAFCKQTFRFAGAGNGYGAKLINNFLAFNSFVAIAEAMTTAHKAGMELDTLLAAIEGGGGQNRCLTGLGPWLAGHGESRSRVKLETAAKDVGYYCLLARELGTLGPVAEQVRARLLHGVADGLGGELTPQYISHVAAAAGVRLPASP
jgi:3-hydroxyisobutyrate dehydrogenase-like beta-hydroxyacid dehydrogenase